jgi:glycosyltransferase involved in cell wall biosynthesis
LKRIGILHYSAPKKEIGGVEIVIDDHIRFLSNMGHKISLIYGSGGGLKNSNVTEYQVPLLSSNGKKILKIQKSILKKKDATKEFIEIKNEIKEELIRILPKLDVCIIHNMPSMPFNFAATAAINEITEETKIKFIFWLHDSILLREEWNEDFRKFPYSLLHYKDKNIIYITPTDFRAKQFSELPEQFRIPSMNVIPNGVNIEEYIKIDETTKLLLNKLDISFEDYIIVSPVRITPRKNIELALHVVDELRHFIDTKALAIKLLITGPPDHQARKQGKDYLKWLYEIVKNLDLKKNVIFCHDIVSHEREYENGGVKKWNVADVYNIADLIFIPSKEEGFGLPVIEAGAARKPIFCSRIPPFKELIKDDIEGNMFDLTESPRDIAFRIYKLFITHKVENNFNNVVKNFNWETIINEKLMPLL